MNKNQKKKGRKPKWKIPRHKDGEKKLEAEFDGKKLADRKRKL